MERCEETVLYPAAGWSGEFIRFMTENPFPIRRAVCFDALPGRLPGNVKYCFRDDEYGFLEQIVNSYRRYLGEDMTIERKGDTFEFCGNGLHITYHLNTTYEDYLAKDGPKITHVFVEGAAVPKEIRKLGQLTVLSDNTVPPEYFSNEEVLIHLAEDEEYFYEA